MGTVPVYFTFWHTDTGQLSTVTAPGSKVWDFDYNAVGQTTAYNHPNSLDSVFSYDGGNRMTKIELKDVSTVKESFAYALDKTGNATSRWHPAGKMPAVRVVRAGHRY